MNIDILVIIAQYLSYNDYITFSQINKETFKYLKMKIPLHVQKEWCLKQLSEYPDVMLKFFDPIKLYKVPIISLGKKRGHTDYIDFIKPSYFKNNKVIRGTDIYNRPFISFMYYVNNNKQITTIFQRYSDCDVWVIAGQHLPGLQNSSLVFDYDKFDNNSKLFSELLKHGKANYEYIDIFTDQPYKITIYS